MDAIRIVHLRYLNKINLSGALNKNKFYFQNMCGMVEI